MHSPLRVLRSLLACAVALTFSHAAVVDNTAFVDKRTDPFNRKQHTGWFLIQVAYDDYGATVYDPWGKIGVASPKNGFVRLDPDATLDSGVALFTFYGCQAGPAVFMYCTNCDPENDSNVAASYPTGWDTNGIRLLPAWLVQSLMPKLYPRLCELANRFHPERS